MASSNSGIAEYCDMSIEAKAAGNGGGRAVCGCEWCLEPAVGKLTRYGGKFTGGIGGVD